MTDTYGQTKARHTERGPVDSCCSEPDEAELTWAGLPYHIWKEVVKFSDRRLAPRARE